MCSIELLYVISHLQYEIWSEENNHQCIMLDVITKYLCWRRLCVVMCVLLCQMILSWRPKNLLLWQHLMFVVITYIVVNICQERILDQYLFCLWYLLKINVLHHKRCLMVLLNSAMVYSFQRRNSMNKYVRYTIYVHVHVYLKIKRTGRNLF